ncbi:hypothetical protein MKZ38_000675 [Zalerion maritima]|uniref:Selenoprotein O n=1 Tax=Zalerion maritima TaxID=339359 RepID=A0AAD5WSE5_9PEZI|nr:hypothetical protein MKZ38_000675 [Zalerion maritima]
MPASTKEATAAAPAATCEKPTHQFSPSSPEAARISYNPPPSSKPISQIPKSWNFTQKLPPDPLFPTPASSHATPRGNIMPRTVKGALYTFVRPVGAKDPELLAVSPAALRDLGLSDPESREFRDTVAGNVLHGWDPNKASPEGKEGVEEGYPWAQCYGGFQFGHWAGQLGDGRAISLFETTPPTTAAATRDLDANDKSVDLRYEIQLKGAGLTPYSRFADGKAVLRSSIREFVVSEYLHALGIPSTRALSLTLLPREKVRRERIEPGAIVCRFAQTWVRLGTFDLLRARGERGLTRKLAGYAAEDIFGGWDKLPSRLPDSIGEDGALDPPRGVSEDVCEGPPGDEENRFARLYREVVRRNAITVARWQAYGFMNGVLNTDNTSIYGLSIDFGPFAFMDAFDPSYTPNHDDHGLRYSFRNQPTIVWWNLVRLGEALGELMGAGPTKVDDTAFVEKGVGSEEEGEELVKRAEKVIERAGEEYKSVFMGEYKRLMAKRLGLKGYKEGDFEELFSEALDVLELGGLDFHFFFRRLGEIRVSELEGKKERENLAERFYYKSGGPMPGVEKDVRKAMGEWLGKWRDRIVEDWVNDEGEVTEERETERMQQMMQVNPNFVPRGWILDEVITRVEKEGERDVLRRIVQMSLHPFAESWDGKTLEGEEEDKQGMAYKGDREEEVRWTSDVRAEERAMQCSCSS